MHFLYLVHFARYFWELKTDNCCLKATRKLPNSQPIQRQQPKNFAKSRDLYLHLGSMATDIADRHHRAGLGGGRVSRQRGWDRAFAPRLHPTTPARVMNEVQRGRGKFYTAARERRTHRLTETTRCGDWSTWRGLDADIIRDSVSFHDLSRKLINLLILIHVTSHTPALCSRHDTYLQNIT